MKRTDCDGCYNEVYHTGTGGSYKCWSFDEAEIILRKEVHINDNPPHRKKARRLPNCYSKQKYVYINE